MSDQNGHGVLDLGALKAQKAAEAEQEQAEAAQLATVAPELQEDFKRLQIMVRGNTRLSLQLRSLKNQEIDLRMIIMIRLDVLVEVLLGKAETDNARLQYELKFVESLRSIVEQALREP